RRMVCHLVAGRSGRHSSAQSGRGGRGRGRSHAPSTRGDGSRVMSDQPQSWPAVLGALIQGEDLSAEATAWAMNDIMSGQATGAQIAGFAVGLRAKGETVDEIDGMVRAMYEHATPFHVSGRALATGGAGGERGRTVGVGRVAAVVAAGAGARAVKHGTRAASSAWGAAGLLEELGVSLDLEPRRVAEIADEVGITFCFAPAFQP